MPHRLSDHEVRGLGTPALRFAVSRADSVRETRRLVRDLASGALSRRRLHDALLLTSELVSNSLLHAREGPITVWAGLDADRLRVEVHDQGPGLAAGYQPVRARPGQAGGRGLPLVDALSDRWGHRRAAWAMVWFEIDRPRRSRPLRAVPDPRG